MLGSKSNFFKQSRIVLKTKKENVYNVLIAKGYTTVQVEVYLEAFDYFVFNPTQYDGATVVKDLCDIPNLDLDAMLHDYHYIVHNVGCHFVTKWHADWLFAKQMERKGKGQYSAFSRFAGLTITGIAFVPYTYFKRKKLKDVAEFYNDYKLLMHT